MAEESQEERTEEPTEKRRRESREKGQVAQSKEVNTALLFLASLLLWYFYIPGFWHDLKAFITHVWRGSNQFAASDPNSIDYLLNFIVKYLFDLFWPIFLTVVVISILASFVQFGWLFTWKPLEPDPTKLDPIKGASKFVSKRSFVEILKSLAKVIIVALIAYVIIHGRIEKALRLVDSDLPITIGFIARTFFSIMTMSCIVLLVLAVLDYLFVRWETEEKMKMTKQEVKEEHKETEGDPQIKQRIRSLQRQMAKQRMMSEVPESDVVITNPTHIAVVLKYDRHNMDAPQVTAKGSGYLAWRIKELARDNKVPIVENPSLARILNKIDIGQEIPEDLFRAVAEILAYVYKLKGKSSS